MKAHLDLTHRFIYLCILDGLSYVCYENSNEIKLYSISQFDQKTKLR